MPWGRRRIYPYNYLYHNRFGRSYYYGDYCDDYIIEDNYCDDYFIEVDYYPRRRYCRRTRPVYIF